MAVPTYDKFIEPILRFLASKPEGVLAREAHDAAADTLGLTEAERSERLPSGTQAVYKNRGGWAQDRLKRAGLSMAPKRGFWKLTEAGRKYVKEHPTALTEEQLQDLATGHTDVRLRPLKNGEGEDSESSPGSEVRDEATIQSPDDRLDSALGELRESVAAELLETMASCTPLFFESLVLDVLHAMGYGTGGGVQRVGGSGDGGIDGIISLDRLGLEKVYVQAKRWQSTVGRPEIQGFYGALAGQRATRGVFITTSAFTKQAVEFAQSVDSIVLVDGHHLAQLMIEFGVGVSHRKVKVPAVDSDYFE